MERLYVTHQYLPVMCCRIDNSCDRYTLYLYFGIDILSSCFLCLVRDAPALPGWLPAAGLLSLFRVFVLTAAVLPGVNPLTHDVPVTSR